MIAQLGVWSVWPLFKILVSIKIIFTTEWELIKLGKSVLNLLRQELLHARLVGKGDSHKFYQRLYYFVVSKKRSLKTYSLWMILKNRMSEVSYMVLEAHNIVFQVTWVDHRKMWFHRSTFARESSESEVQSIILF